MFPDLVFNRGFAYYKNKHVHDLLFDINHNIWTANVQGTEAYFVEVNLTNFDNGSISAYCDCPAFDTYDTCKHIVAVLLSAADQTGVQQTPEVNYRATDRFITAITSTQRSEAEFLPTKVPMLVEYYCKWSYDRNLYIELKAGEQRAFVVRDVYEYLENVLQNREHYFTKTFTYHPDTHYFLQRDLELFELLYSFLRNEEIYSSYTFYQYQGKGKDKRSVTVPPLLVKELLEKLVERDLTVELNEQSYTHTEIVEDDLPFAFSLSKNDQEDLMLQMDKIEESTYFDPYQLLFSQGKFYFPTKEQIPVIEQITSLRMDHYQLPIMKDQADVFLSEVLPSLKKVGAVEISEKVASEVIQVPLRAKMFLEAQADWIVGKLEYHYGNHEIDPFNGREENDVIIIRDVEKEQQIMSLIEYASFRYNGKDLYIEADEDELYEFLYTILPILDEHVELFLTSEVRGFIVENEPIPSTSVRLGSDRQSTR